VLPALDWAVGNAVDEPNSSAGIGAAIIPAAGRGDRLGPGRPKALRPLGGVPMLVYAVHAMAQARAMSLVVVAAPSADVLDVRTALADHHFAAEIDVVAGGETRRESVRLALAALPAEADVVLVHDAARPLVPIETVDAVAGAVRDGAAAVVPALPVADTVKQVGAGQLVVRTLDRSSLRAVQTPQGFTRQVLEDAHAKAAADQAGEATDDAGLVERLGVDVLIVPGSEEAFKITRPLDLVLAEAVVARRREGRPLVTG
jgi:2-C-methyl-D-erythritol 4-phosphate cytidylyltransferase